MSSIHQVSSSFFFMPKKKRYTNRYTTWKENIKKEAVLYLEHLGP